MVNVIEIKIVKDSRNFKSILTDLIKTLSKIHCVNLSHNKQQTKDKTMTTTYKSKNFDKRLSKWCAENRKAKAIRNSLTNEQREQVKKDIANACNFINQTFKNKEAN